MMAYPLVYLFIWTIPTTIRIYQSTTNKAAPFPIGTIDKVDVEAPLISSYSANLSSSSLASSFKVLQMRLYMVSTNTHGLSGVEFSGGARTGERNFWDRFIRVDTLHFCLLQ